MVRHTSGVLGVFSKRDRHEGLAFGSGWIDPGSDEHRGVISPSKVAAILGVSRYESAFRLWHRMKGTLPGDPPSDIFDVGHDFEPAAANRWLRRNPGWKLSPGEVQYHVDPEKFGFPALATPDRRAARGNARKLVELKTARDLIDWGDEFTDDCPMDYAAQMTAQMLFTGLIGYPSELLVLGPFFNDHVYRIPYDKSVALWIITACRSFYESLSRDTPPTLDDSVHTYQAVRQLHPGIDRGVRVQLDADLAAGYLDALDDHRTSEVRVRSLKTRVLAAMGNAETALVGDTLVAKRIPHASGGVALKSGRKTNAADVNGRRPLPPPNPWLVANRPDLSE